MLYKEPGPPSSHSESFEVAQVFVHVEERPTELLRELGGAESPTRGPQSAQSLPSAQMLYKEPGPPSSHSESFEVAQVFVHAEERSCTH